MSKPPISDENARLIEMTSTKEGFQKIEELWLIASNYEKRDGSWFKRSAGAGDKIAGFAIDRESLDFIHTPPGYSHEKAQSELIDKIMKDPDGKVRFEKARHRAIRGWLAFTDEFAYPLLTLDGSLHMEASALKRLEDKVLESELALPLSSRFIFAYKQKWA